MNPPLWVSALLGVDAIAWKAYRLMEIVRDEALFGWLDHRYYDVVTQASYETIRAYLPGGATHEAGLFPWEIDIISSPPFPSLGTILLGGAGGGRELAGLLARGYHVVAFEPNPVLVRGALVTAGASPRAVVVQASYRDLVQMVHGRRGPLSDAVAGRAFDGVILGWGSLTHVIEPEDRYALFAALRTIAPHAPVLASFFLRHAHGRQPGATGGQRARAAVRRIFRCLGANQRPPEGLCFQRSGGFVYSFLQEELIELAASCRYHVDKFSERDFPHALLVPDP